jgi:hypothetical protein
MKPGKHAVYLEWKSPDHGACYSELTPFETVAGEDQELLLELVAAKTVRGRLGPEVPRPVEDGEVSIGVQFREPESQGALLVRRGAPSRPTGRSSWRASARRRADRRHLQGLRGGAGREVEGVRRALGASRARPA